MYAKKIMFVILANPMKHCVCKETYVCNPSTCTCETNKYLKSIVNDLVITSVEIIAVSNNLSIKLNDKKATCKMDNY